jgi:hypothetical protein
MADDSLYYKSTAAVVLGVFWRETKKWVVQISKLLHYSSRENIKSKNRAEAPWLQLQSCSIIKYATKG